MLITILLTIGIIAHGAGADKRPCEASVRDAAHAHCSIISRTTGVNMQHIAAQKDDKFEGKLISERYVPSQVIGSKQYAIEEKEEKVGQYGTRLHGYTKLPPTDVAGDETGDGIACNVTAVNPSGGRHSKNRLKRQLRRNGMGTLYAVYPEAMTLSYSAIGLVPGLPDPVTIDATITFSDDSSVFQGQRLWKLTMYGSKNIDGTGEKFQFQHQTLSSSQQAHPVTPGGDMIIEQATGAIDMLEIGCSKESRYLCFDFMKGDSPSVSFTFTSFQADTSKITLCSDRCETIEDTAVIRGLIYDFEYTDPISGDKNPFTGNATAVFSQASDDIYGTGLWKLSMYASNNADGSGLRWEHIDQLLTSAQQNTPLASGQNITFIGVSGEFNFSLVGCNSRWRYLCFEFSGGDNPNPTFNIRVIGSTPTAYRLCTDRCPAIDGGVLTSGISVTFSTIGGVQPGVKDQFVVNATVRFSPVSDNIVGFGLWKLSMYGSKNSDGSGEQFQRFDQMLTNIQQAQSLIDAQDIAFYGARGELDITQVGCDIEFRYLCFDFMKGDYPYSDFNYTSYQTDTTRTTVCSNRCPPNEGYAIVTGMSINWTAFRATPGQRNRFAINATMSFSQSSGTHIQGIGLWKLSMYGSSNGDGSGDHYQQVDQVLNASQQAQPMSENTLRFTNAIGRLDFWGIGCGRHFRYLCFDFKKGDHPFPDYNFTSRVGGAGDDSSKVTLCSDRCPQLEDDGFQDGFILVADLGGAVRVAPLPTSNDGVRFEEIPLDNLDAPLAVDYDPVLQKVYFTDALANNIQRANLDGSMQEVVLQLDPQSVPEGLALDTVNRVIYWTDATLNRIERVNMDRSERSVVVNSEEPRAIVVDTTNGKLYWTERGFSPKIEKANVDGSSRQTLVNTGLQWPNGLAIDFTAGRIFWCDAGVNRIESTDLNGNNRIVHLDTGNDVDIHPFDLGLLDNSVLWSDWAFNRIVKTDIGLENAGVAWLIGNSVFTRGGGLHIHQASQSRTRRSASHNNGPFAKCHDVVDSSEFFDKCFDSWCSSQSYDQYCDDVGAYAIACRLNGVEVNGWELTTGCDNKIRN